MAVQHVVQRSIVSDGNQLGFGQLFGLGVLLVDQKILNKRGHNLGLVGVNLQCLSKVDDCLLGVAVGDSEIAFDPQALEGIRIPRQQPVSRSMGRLIQRLRTLRESEIPTDSCSAQLYFCLFGFGQQLLGQNEIDEGIGGFILLEEQLPAAEVGQPVFWIFLESFLVLQGSIIEFSLLRKLRSSFQVVFFPMPTTSRKRAGNGHENPV